MISSNRVQIITTPIVRRKTADFLIERITDFDRKNYGVKY